MNDKEKKDFFNRNGIIRVKEIYFFEYPNIIHNFLKDFMVVRAENDFMSRTIKYWCYSKLFKKTIEGEVANDYYLRYIFNEESTTDNKDHKFTLIKIELLKLGTQMDAIIYNPRIQPTEKLGG